MELVLYPADESIRCWSSSRHYLSYKDVTYKLMFRFPTTIFWLQVFAVGWSIWPSMQLPFIWTFHYNKQMNRLDFLTEWNV